MFSCRNYHSFWKKKFPTNITLQGNLWGSHSWFSYGFLSHQNLFARHINNVFISIAQKFDKCARSTVILAQMWPPYLQLNLTQPASTYIKLNQPFYRQKLKNTRFIGIPKITLTEELQRLCSEAFRELSDIGKSKKSQEKSKNSRKKVEKSRKTLL